MRREVLQELLRLAEEEERLVLLTADLGYTVLEPFAERFPARFFNVGVAEQNMIGLATGLAESGMIPFCYSMSTFATLRPFEVIRNGPLYHQLPVRILGVGGGFEYGSAGWTHFGLEDVALMRVLPEMTVVVPADSCQARQALRATWNLPGPVYYRLGKNEQQTVPGLNGRFRLQQIETVRTGEDALVLAMGPPAISALNAAESLEKEGVHAAVGIVSCLSPAPTEALMQDLALYPLVFTVEAHFVSGGLGSLVAETIAEHSLTCCLQRIGVSFIPRGRTGSEAHMNHVAGLSEEAIARRILSACRPGGSANG